MSIQILGNFSTEKNKYELKMQRMSRLGAKLKKPKRSLSAYMIFVKQVSQFKLKGRLVDALKSSWW